MCEGEVGGGEEPHQVEAVAAGFAVGQKDDWLTRRACNGNAIISLRSTLVGHFAVFVVQIVWRFNVEIQQILQIINFGQKRGVREFYW